MNAKQKLEAELAALKSSNVALSAENEKLKMELTGVHAELAFRKAEAKGLTGAVPPPRPPREDRAPQTKEEAARLLAQIII